MMILCTGESQDNDKNKTRFTVNLSPYIVW